MSLLSDETNATLIKQLLIGDSKVGKSDYAMQAAVAGFNVLYMDGDVAKPTLMNPARLPVEARKRLYYLDVGDYIDDNGDYVNRFADSIKEFALAKGTFLWNATRGEFFVRHLYAPTDRVDIIRPHMLDHNWVWVIDSWSSYAQSVKMWKANSLGEDLAEVEKFGRDLYSGVGNKLTHTLTLIQAARCHVIVIAHSDTDEVKRKPDGVKVSAVKETDMIIVGTKQVPLSSSRPHSRTMGKHFTDVGWLEMKGKNRRLSFDGSEERIAGGHFAQYANLTPETGSFAKLIEIIGGVIPSSQEQQESFARVIKTHGPGEYEIPQSQVLKPKVQASSASVESPPADRIVGLAGLLKPKQG